MTGTSVVSIIVPIPLIEPGDDAPSEDEWANRMADAYRQLQDSGFSPIGWKLPVDTSKAELLTLGRLLITASPDSSWAWADFLIFFCSKKYGALKEAITEVSKIGGPTYGTAANIIRVGKRFPSSRRRDNLPFSHHCAVAKLKPVEQDEWLDRAEREGMTRKVLTAALQDAEVIVKKPAKVRAVAPSPEPTEVSKVDMLRTKAEAFVNDINDLHEAVDHLSPDDRQAVAKLLEKVSQHSTAAVEDFMPKRRIPKL